VHNLGHQTRHFIFKRRHLPHQTIRLPSLVQGRLCFTLQQRQATFEVWNPRQVLSTSTRLTRRRLNPRVGHIGGRRVTITIRWSTGMHRLEGKRRKGKTTQKHIEWPSVTLHKSKVFTGSIEFPDRISAKDGKVYYINSKEKKLQREG
jgi:hypothetical protein